MSTSVVTRRVVRFCVRSVICLATDWLERIPYSESLTGWRRWIGAQAQVVWFRAHNNRLYGWSVR